MTLDISPVFQADDISRFGAGASQQFTYDWTVPEGADPGTFRYWVVVATTDGIYLSDWSAAEALEIGGSE